MRDEAYEQYKSESSTWLKAARLKLLAALMAEHAGRGRQLRILEVGAGVGQNVEVLREFGSVDVLEIDPVGLEALRHLDGVDHVIDLPVPHAFEATYDVIVAFDVLEHLEDDAAATTWVAEHLNEGGHFIATVPAYQWLFSDHDMALDHFRRYTKKRLVAAMPPDLAVRRTTYFVSFLLPLAALIRILGKVAKGVRPPRTAEAVVHKQSSTVPGFLDRFFLGVLTVEVGVVARGHDLPFGLSVVCVAQKAR